MSADVIHHGHINIINEARKYGDVTIGLVADEIVAKHKRLPYLNWEQRKKIIENIKGLLKFLNKPSGIITLQLCLLSLII